MKQITFGTHRVIYLITLLLIINISWGQDTLTIKKTFGGSSIYTASGDKISIANAIQWSDDNPQAKGYFRKAQTNVLFSNILDGVGGFLIGFQLGGAIVSGKVGSPESLLIGAGLIGVAIPFEIGKNRNLKIAVEFYNKPYRSAR